MKKDIYDLLNDGEFNEESYSDIEGEKLNDIEAQKIVSYVKKNSKVKQRNFKGYIIAAAASILLCGMCFSGVGSQVMAQIKEKFNPDKNYEADYVVELDESDSKDGIEMKLDECSRSMFNVTFRYTITFENGLPESIKSDVYTDNSINFQGSDSYNYSLYKRDSNCNIFVNDTLIDNTFKYLEKEEEIGIIDSRDIEITDNSITKELSIGIRKSVLDKDINIKIQYDNIVDSSGNAIPGPWTIEHTIKAEENEDEVEKVSLENPYKYTFEDGTSISFDSFSNTNTGIKLYGREAESEDFHFHAFILKGRDNLGNSVIICPLYSGVTGADCHEYEVIYTLLSYGDDKLAKLDEDTCEIKLQLYNREDNENNYYPAGEQFTINIK